MQKRTMFTTISLAFMFAGAVGGWWLAGDYVKGLDSGSWLWLRFEPEKLSSASEILAKLAFGVGGLLTGFLVSTILYKQIERLRRKIEMLSAQDSIAIVTGLLIGLLLTVLIAASIPPTWYNIAIAVFMCYLGVTATFSMKEHLKLYFPQAPAQGKQTVAAVLQPKVLDTNVIIDGRIADICKAGFVEGPIYIPRFVLEELQQIADSSDSLKRARGRRGLDILNQMQQEMSLQIETYESAGNENGPDEVDAKLIELAKELSGAIVTNDYNLNKVAAIQSIRVLNVNELANALKPVVLPGEEMKVTIVKEGKEMNQGVGYLDDGTMIVVERGRSFMGQTLDVFVTSILQTAAGKMIFAEVRDDRQGEDAENEQSGRGYPGGRTRRKIR